MDSFGAFLERFGWPAAIVVVVGVGMYRGVWPFITNQVWPFLVEQVERLQTAREEERKEFLAAVKEQREAFIGQIRDMEASQEALADRVIENIQASAGVLERALRVIEAKENA